MVVDYNPCLMKERFESQLIIKMSVVLLILLCTPVFTLPDYWMGRDQFIKQEESQMLGSDIVLTKDEEAANKVIKEYKSKACSEGFRNSSTYLASKHFFEVKEDIEKSDVFAFIKSMPKGAALHGHDTALVSEEYLYNLTFHDDLYSCNVTRKLKLMFLADPSQDTACNWTLVKTARAEDPSYDSWLKSHLTLTVDNPREKYRYKNDAWNALNDIFEATIPMLTYKPVFEKYFYRALLELYVDNVIYLEFRGTLPTVYELDGKQYTPVEVAGLYVKIIEQFKKDYPDFIGARLIYAPVRNVDNATVSGYIETAKDVKKTYPNFLAGFDLVGHEDDGRPLSDFIDQLKSLPEDINLIFHAAETNWYGVSTDMNLIDAVLLGTKRIGHGYGITKHPEVMRIVKEKKIAIEVCPISNQVLMYVEDLRNHPASLLIGQGFPVVISYDDPSFWSTKGLSYDFYMAFMGIASNNADLKLLKQLAKNSLLYSVLPEDEKQLAIAAWEKQWEKFVKSAKNLAKNKSHTTHVTLSLIIVSILMLLVINKLLF